MRNIVIKLHVDVDVALKNNQLYAGDCDYQISEDLLGELSDAEKETMLKWCALDDYDKSKNWPRLEVLEATKEAIIAAIKTEHEARVKELAEKEAQTAKTKAEYNALLAGPMEAILRYSDACDIGTRWSTRVPYKHQHDELYIRASNEAERRNNIERCAAFEAIENAGIEDAVVENADGKWVTRYYPISWYSSSATHKAAAAEAERRNAALEAEHTKIKKEFVDEFGTESQQERFVAGMLPVDELLALARERHLPNLPTYDKLQARDVAHKDDCERCCDGEVAFDSAELDDSLTEKEWEKIKGIKQELEIYQPLETTVRVHNAECTICDASTYRLGVRAVKRWAGHIISREYAV